MLDIKFVRENVDAVNENLVKRGMPEKAEDVDRLVSLDAKWRELLVEAERLRKSRNEITATIAQVRKKGQDATALMKQAEVMPEKIKDIDVRVDDYKKQAENILLNVPNMVHESVPFGKDENDNQEVKKWGEPPKFNFKASDHIDLGLKHGLIDVERAGRVAGARFYYLRDDLVRLNYSLIQYGLDFMLKKEGLPALPDAVLSSTGHYRRRGSAE